MMQDVPAIVTKSISSALRLNASNGRTYIVKKDCSEIVIHRAHDSRRMRLNVEDNIAGDDYVTVQGSIFDDGRKIDGTRVYGVIALHNDDGESALSVLASDISRKFD